MTHSMKLMNIGRIARVPVLLRVCQDSRYVALKNYQFCFPEFVGQDFKGLRKNWNVCVSEQKKTWFDFEGDALFMDMENPMNSPTHFLSRSSCWYSIVLEMWERSGNWWLQDRNTARGRNNSRILNTSLACERSNCGTLLKMRVSRVLRTWGSWGVDIAKKWPEMTSFEVWSGQRKGT